LGGKVHLLKPRAERPLVGGNMALAVVSDGVAATKSGAIPYAHWESILCPTAISDTLAGELSLEDISPANTSLLEDQVIVKAKEAGIGGYYCG